MNSRILSVLLLLIGGFLASCSERDSNQQTFTEKDIAFDQLETFLSFKSDSIASPADIAFLYADTIAIFDNKLTSVLLYDTNGRLINQFGKKGKGPGEFVRPAGLRIVENHIYVLDFDNFGISEFNSDGNFLERHSFEGESIGFAQTSMIDSERYLAPANGKQGSLLQLINPADSSLYFGEAVVEQAGTINLPAAKKQISNREVPDMFKNIVLTDVDDEGYYAFLQSSAQLQRYDRMGKLEWEKAIELPIKEKIFDQFIERNEKMQANAIYPLSYGSAMQVTSDALYLLMNVPEDEKEMLLQFDKMGNMQTIYRIESGESNFSNFVVNPSESMLYLTDISMGNIYRMIL